MVAEWPLLVVLLSFMAVIGLALFLIVRPLLDKQTETSASADVPRWRVMVWIGIGMAFVVAGALKPRFALFIFVGMMVAGLVSFLRQPGEVKKGIYEALKTQERQPRKRLLNAAQLLLLLYIVVQLVRFYLQD